MTICNNCEKDTVCYESVGGIPFCRECADELTITMAWSRKTGDYIPWDDEKEDHSH